MREDQFFLREEDFWLRGDDVFPHEQDFWLRGDDVFPHEDDFWLRGDDVFPHEEDFWLRGDDVFPHEEDFFPHEEHFLPHGNAFRNDERGTDARGHAYRRRGAGVTCSVEQRMAGGEPKDGGGDVKVDISRLPIPGSDLVGRDDETKWLDACWSERAHVATIVAPGGVGKSTLVWSWVQRMLADGWRGAERVYAWSFYSQGANDQQVSADPFVHAALAWLGDADPSAGGPWEKVDRLVAALRARRTLLVLDGLEPLQWASGPEVEKLKDKPLSLLMWRLAEQNPGLCVITSRLPVRDVGDFAKEKSRRLDLGKLSDEAGEKLLRARGVVGEEGELRKTVREYRGHALALALLGSYLAEVGEGDVRRRREIGPLVEAEELGGHAKRVMAAYEKMFGQKSAEVGILRMLGLFDRPATEGEVKALRAEPVVAGLTEGVPAYAGREWKKAVERLRRVGLVERAGHEGDKRLDAHPLVREHFGERVRTEQPEAWREGNGRLYEYLKGVAKELPETVREMEPLYAAVVHGCRAGKNQVALHEVWLKRIQREDDAFSINRLGAFGNEVAALSAFFDPPWERLTPGLAEPDQVGVLASAGFALRALGRLPDAAGPMRMAVERLIALEDRESAAIAASELSKLLQTRGELDDALEQARKSVALADESGNARQRINRRATLATALHTMGLREEAAAELDEAERMQEEMQPEYPLLYSLRGFWCCDLLLDQGQDAEVRERAAKTLKIAEGEHWLLDIAVDHLSLGRAHLLGAQRGTGGDLAQAASHLKDAVDGLRLAGAQHHLPLGLLARAALHTHNRAFDLAREDLREALDIATRCGFRLHECDAQLGWARLCIAQGEPGEARRHLATAREIIDETGYHRRDEELRDLEALRTKKEGETARAQGTQGAQGIDNSLSLASLASLAPLAVISPAPGTPSPPPSPAPGHAPMSDNHARAPVDFLLFAPLEEERDALLSKLPGYRKLDSDGSDVHVYFEAEVTTRRQDKAVYRVIVTSPARMGPIHAAITATTATERWRPEQVIVVGIAGGLKDEVRLGDVMVAQSVADYTVGKVREDGTREERWEMIPADAALLNAANAFRSGWEAHVSEPRPEAEGKPVRHAGLVASGGDVIASKKHIATYQQDMPKLIGVEMEGGGVATALHHHRLRPRFLMIRGVSDLADGEGNAAMKHRWRAYARDVAAAYTLGLLMEGPVPAARR